MQFPLTFFFRIKKIVLFNIDILFEVCILDIIGGLLNRCDINIVPFNFIMKFACLFQQGRLYRFKHRIVIISPTFEGKFIPINIRRNITSDHGCFY